MLHIPDARAAETAAMTATQADKPLKPGAFAALVAGVCILVCIGGASVWQAISNRAALDRARGTRAELTTLTDVLITAQDAETGQRGYLLTLNPDYLEPFTSAAHAMPALLTRLGASRGDDPRVRELRAAVGRKFAELEKTIALAQSGKATEAIALVRTDSGRASMLEIRALVASIERDLDAKVAEQVGGITRSNWRLIAIDIAGLLMIVALGGLIAVGLRSYLASLAQARLQAADAYAALQQNNERLDEAVRARTADLTAANEEIQRFAYIVSHDLRAPLVNIMGFTSEMEQAVGALSAFTAAQDAPPAIREAIVEDIPEALRFIRTSTTKMDRLINAILRLSREGRRVLTPERLDMRVMFDGMVDSMSHQAASKNAKVTVGAVPSIVGDRLAVEQVFSNVLENALKYLKPGRPGEIHVSGTAEGGMARFEISDNGRGIAEKDYERVFELFRRAGDQTVPGEGIGLAHVRALVRRLGGAIDCRSILDVGTTFTIYLPLAAAYSREIAA